MYRMLKENRCDGFLFCILALMAYTHFTNFYIRKFKLILSY